ncbi:hypothetical protein PR048_004388 [Dryococelus australis]|uniref:Uncharacterized protein n=1 Tax=Dryococelus australis TaxID=614101 RepID=A0ABQ9I6E0_9NEOP|nr:hypothetical protein PR048_004388 [Dryococelus australis]
MLDNAAGRSVFLGDLPFTPPLHSGTALYSLQFTLIGSQDLHSLTSFKGLPAEKTYNTIVRGITQAKNEGLHSSSISTDKNAATADAMVYSLFVMIYVSVRTLVNVFHYETVRKDDKTESVACGELLQVSLELHGGYWLLLHVPRMYSSEQALAYLAAVHHTPLLRSVIACWLNFTALYTLEPASFLNWLQPRCEVTPFLSELYAIGAHDCEVFIYWRRVTQGVSNEVWSNDKRVAKAAIALANILSYVTLRVSYTRASMNPHKKNSSGLRSGDRAGHATGPPLPIHTVLQIPFAYVAGPRAAYHRGNLEMKIAGIDSTCAQLRHQVRPNEMITHNGHLDVHRQSVLVSYDAGCMRIGIVPHVTVSAIKITYFREYHFISKQCNGSKMRSYCALLQKRCDKSRRGAKSAAMNVRRTYEVWLQIARLGDGRTYDGRVDDGQTRRTVVNPAQHAMQWNGAHPFRAQWRGYLLAGFPLQHLVFILPNLVRGPSSGHQTHLLRMFSGEVAAALETSRGTIVPQLALFAMLTCSRMLATCSEVWVCYSSVFSSLREGNFSIDNESGGNHDAHLYSAPLRNSKLAQTSAVRSGPEPGPSVRRRRFIHLVAGGTDEIYWTRAAALRKQKKHKSGKKVWVREKEKELGTWDDFCNFGSLDSPRGRKACIAISFCNVVHSVRRVARHDEEYKSFLIHNYWSDDRIGWAYDDLSCFSLAVGRFVVHVGAIRHIRHKAS